MHIGVCDYTLYLHDIADSNRFILPLVILGDQLRLRVCVHMVWGESLHTLHAYLRLHTLHAICARTHSMHVCVCTHTMHAVCAYTWCESVCKRRHAWGVCKRRHGVRVCAYKWCEIVCAHGMRGCIHMAWFVLSQSGARAPANLASQK